MKIRNILTIPIMALAITACGKPAVAPSKPTSDGSDAPKAIASELIADGKLTVGTSADFPPYEYYEGNEIVGIDPEIVGAIGERLGVEVEFMDMEFNNIITSLATGRIDMAAAGLTVNEERKKNVDFTDFYGGSVQVFLVRKDGPVSAVEDVDGKKIGTQLGTIGDIYAQDDFGEDAVSSFPKFSEAVLALQNGNVDAVLMDQISAVEFQKANDDLTILDETYADEEYAFGFKKGNEELVEEINKIIAELKADGTIDSIFDKHIN